MIALMNTRLLIVNGHPDPSSRRYCAALCDAYAAGVRSRGWKADRLEVGGFPTPASLHLQESSDVLLLTSESAIDRICEADRLAIVFPLWLGAAPHALQLLFESVALATNLRPLPVATDLVVTMDMPALLYRSQIGAHRKSGAQRNPFYLQGVRADQATLIGNVNVMAQRERERWLGEVHALAGRAVDRAARRRSILGWRVPVSLSAWLPQAISRHESRIAPRH
jgi:putative NADPH-quinone reductase